MPRQGTQRINVLPGAVILYVVFAAASLLGLVWEPLLPLGFFAWPYPFLLSVQRFINPNGNWAWAAALVAGLMLVAISGAVVQRRLQGIALSGARVWLVSLLVVAVPLGAITGLMQGIAWAAGWPAGE